jgi:hypothetical protein
MALNRSVVAPLAKDMPVKFAKPKEGALTDVCGLLLASRPITRQSQNMTVTAKATAGRNVFAHSS